MSQADKQNILEAIIYKQLLHTIQPKGLTEMVIGTLLKKLFRIAIG